MRIINVTPKMDALLLGKQGENKSTKFLFDVSGWLEDYPGCTIGLNYRPAKSNVSYPCILMDENNGKKSWLITSSELVNDGDGLAELVCILDEVVEKDKRTWKTKVNKSLGGSGTAPDPWENWEDTFIELAERAEDAAEDAEEAKEAAEEAASIAAHAPIIQDGYWYEWDATTEQYVNTEVKAQGEDGDPGQDATPDLITEDYSDLTFPVAEGKLCYHSGLLYKANQAIATSEEWTAAHWTQTTIEAEHCALKTEINSKADEPTGTKSAGKVYGLDSNLNPAWVDGGGGSVDPSVVEQKVNAWLSANITNPDSPPLDRSLSSGSAAAPADIVGEIANLEAGQTTGPITSFVQGNVDLQHGTIDPTGTTQANSGMIDMKAGDSYSYNRSESKIAAASYYVIYDTNGNYVTWGQTNNGNSFTFDRDGKFLIVAVQNGTQTMEDIIATANASFTATLSSKTELLNTIEEHEERLDAVEDSIGKSAGASKIIKNTVPSFEWITGKYIKASDGSIVTVANNNYKISDFLEIPEGAYCVVCDATNIENAASVNIVSFYRSDSADTYISGIALEGQSSFYKIVPDDAKYFIIGSNTSSNGIYKQLNDNILFLYGELFNELKFKLHCAPKYDVIKNEAFEFFYKGIVNGPTENYSVLTRGSAVGSNLTKKFVITPTGDTDLFFDLYDEKKTMNATVKTTLKAHDAPTNPSSMKTILCVGDSLTSPGIWPEEFKRRLMASDGTPTGFGLTNVQFIGTVTHNDVKYEGYGGWSWNSYNTSGYTSGEKVITTTHDKTEAEDQHSVYHDSNNATWKLETISTGKIKIILQTGSATNFPSSGTLTWVSGGTHHSDITYSAVSAGSANPFWNDISGEVDFANYAAEQGASSIDYLYVLLGWNEASVRIPQLKEKAQTFITNVHDSFPNAKIVLVGLEIPSRDGLGYNYTPNMALSNYQEMMDFVFNVDDMNAELASENSNVYSLSIAAQFDTDHNMQTTALPYNLRNATTELVQTNGVHPADSGYLQIADAVTRHFVGLLEEE